MKVGDYVSIHTFDDGNEWQKHFTNKWKIIGFGLPGKLKLQHDYVKSSGGEAPMVIESISEWKVAPYTGDYNDRSRLVWPTGGTCHTK